MDDATLTLNLCAILGDLDGFEWSEDPDVEYAAESIGVFYGAIGETPHRAVGLRVYGTPDRVFVRRRRVQAWIRGDRFDRPGADRIAGAVFTRFDNLSREGGIVSVKRDSMSPLGADDNDRERRSENYMVTLDNDEASI